MFAPANQTHFSLNLPGVEHDLQVLEFTGFEALSQPFVFEVTLVSQRPDLDLEALLGQPAFLALNADGSGIHAQVHACAQGDSGQRLTRYHLTLRPQLAWLGHRILARQGIPARKRWLPALPGLIGSLLIGACWWPAIF